LIRVSCAPHAARVNKSRACTSAPCVVCSWMLLPSRLHGAISPRNYKAFYTSCKRKFLFQKFGRKNFQVRIKVRMHLIKNHLIKNQLWLWLCAESQRNGHTGSFLFNSIFHFFLNVCCFFLVIWRYKLPAVKWKQALKAEAFLRRMNVISIMHNQTITIPRLKFCGSEWTPI
jgi:hypothetical protein